jgi:type VI secretion system secreted protein VgrG
MNEDTLRPPFQSRLHASSTTEPFALHLEGLTHALTVRSFRGCERFSAPTVFDLDVLTSRKITAKSGSLLGRSAAFVMNAGDAQRVIRGVVVRQRVEGSPVGNDQRQVRVRLASRVWLLSQRRGSRIFQNTSVVEIASTLLRSVGLHVDVRIDVAPQELDYCVQYRETDLDFITRILAEFGIAFALRPEPTASTLDDTTSSGLEDTTLLGSDVGDANPALHVGGERVVLFDQPGAWRDPVRSLLFASAHDDRDGLSIAMKAFSQSARVRPTYVKTRSSDARSPTVAYESDANSRALEAPSTPVDTLALEVYNHRDEYLELIDARFRAPIELGALRRNVETYAGRSNDYALEPGTRMRLDGHREAEFNRAYLVACVRHEGRVASLAGGGDRDGVTYENRVECVASEVMPRPRQRPRPVVQVAETAYVIGHEPGVNADATGRVRVRFFWDRRGIAGSSTAWLRVAQPWAGPHYGAQFLPRVDTEVLVNFLDGDPDRPIIVGALHSEAHPMPFDPVLDRARSGLRSNSIGAEGHNELSFHDTAGAEELHLRAQRNLTERVLHDRLTHVGGDVRTEIGNNRHTHVRGDEGHHVGRDARSHVHRDAFVHVGRERHVNVDGASHHTVRGDAHEKINGAHRSHVEGDTHHRVNGDTNHVVRGSAVTQVGKHDAPKSWSLVADDQASMHATRHLTLSADASVTLRVGRSVVRVTDERIELASPEIRLTADHARFTMHEGGAVMQVNQQLTLRGEQVTVAAAGAGVRLSSEAVIEGSRVALNTGSTSPARLHDPAQEPTRLRLTDDHGEPLGGRPFILRTREGQEYLGITGRDGRAEIDVPDGGTVRFLDLTEVRS